MKIRKITPKDISQIYKLGLRQFRGEFWYTKHFLKDTLKNYGLYYGAFIDKKIIGTIFVRLYNRPQAWIYFFVVDKNYRRKGVGQILLDKIEKSIPKGYSIIIADLEDNDISAKRFYIKNGFKKKAKIKDWFGEKTFGVIYLKRVKS
jgi:ribosomal protein S18 acetylase RimI-like enzyme